jgi:hypothetical protein
MKSKIATGLVLFSMLAALSLGVVFAENATTTIGEDMNKTTNVTTNVTTNATTNMTTNETLNNTTTENATKAA